MTLLCQRCITGAPAKVRLPVAALQIPGIQSQPERHTATKLEMLLSTLVRMPFVVLSAIALRHPQAYPIKQVVAILDLPPPKGTFDYYYM